MDTWFDARNGGKEECGWINVITRVKEGKKETDNKREREKGYIYIERENQKLRKK